MIQFRRGGVYTRMDVALFPDIAAPRGQAFEAFGKQVTSPVVSEANTPDLRDRLVKLIARVGQDRDRSAFRDLFDHFAPRVRSFFLKRGVAGAHADDLTQDVMVSLWRRAESYDPSKASPATWIYTIARNQQIDDYRKASRAAQLDEKDPHFHLDDTPRQDDLVERSEGANAVLEALSKLPDEQGYILKLAFQEALSHREIAERLELPLGTVKSRIRLAMEKMRAAIGDLE